MIIDADCHISPLREGNTITVDELLRRMDGAGVDEAVVWLTPPYGREIDALNEYVHKAVKAHPDRLLGFGWADPRLGLDKARDAVKRCVYEYGFHGVKLNGAQNDYYIDDPQLSLPIVEEIAATEKLIAFHCGVDALDKTHPSRIATIADRYPHMQILCVHMGGVGMPDMAKAAIELAKDHANVTLIGSEVDHLRVLEAINRLGPTRVCFGSDTPFALMHVCVAMYQALLRDLDTEAIGRVMGLNILELFGIQ
jgi:predicted TIM-barrel fold metal-dependent hydrolase